MIGCRTPLTSAGKGCSSYLGVVASGDKHLPHIRLGLLVMQDLGWSKSRKTNHKSVLNTHPQTTTQLYLSIGANLSV
jgi:hypothetical protein